PPAAARERPQLTSYDPRSEPEKTVGIVVAAFTLLQFAGGGALTLSRAGSGAGAGAAGLDYEGVEVRFLGAASGLATGDRSRTWAWPGTATVDALAVALPARLARRSPLLARVLADGTWLRAIFGAASLLVPLAGVGLGIAAVHETGGEALPPVLALTIAIAALGVLDAAAGLAAVLTFALGVLASGGIGSTADVRVMLALGALWFVVPVLAGAVRPLRRPPARGAGAAWDRLADIVIVSLVGAWAVQQIVLALPGLAGVRLPIARHADAVALCVLAALAARTACETIAAHLYPKRLATTEPRDLPRPGAVQRLLAGAVRTAIFVVIAQTIVGSSWQLWVAAALFAVPQVVAVFEHLFPGSRTLFRVLPRGLVAFVLMLLVATAGAALLIDALDERSDSFFADSFLLLALPGFALALMRVFAREDEEPPVGWGKRVAGVAVLAAGVVLALGVAF
ncbi:MAG: hypothetical protein QOI73_96, partial [Solirubrobacteraceae bacterium]|nr:hypothetical protein [Solirubrobacteraceae bacterium]